MIEYVDIWNASRVRIAILDTCQSVIWHSVYYGVGDFEIYIRADSDTIAALQVGYFVTLPDRDDIGIIQKIEISYDAQNGRMITATGSFAKMLLGYRHIYKLNGKQNSPTIVRGIVEEKVREVVANNIINATNTARNISFITLGALAGYTDRIVDDDGYATQKQTSYGNLQSWTDSLLEEYKMSSRLKFNVETKNLEFIVFRGSDRSVGNAAGNSPIVFSQQYDNLLSSLYSIDVSAIKTTALIGGEGEGLARFYSLYGDTASGAERIETLFDKSGMSKTYMDGETEKTYTDAEYKAILDADAKQELSTLKIVETYSGTVDVTNSNFNINEDFYLGDVVTIQDNEINKYINVRITETTEVQDENGYAVNMTYSNEV